MRDTKTNNALNYPIRFEPILKRRVWGGTKYQAEEVDVYGPIGESWEISSFEDNVSIVRNGNLKGKSLKTLISEYKEALLGEDVYAVFGETFPLLFKFIDADQDLSVQLHPYDALAKERHNSFGKTEMWYIIDAEEEAELILGFKENVDLESYLQHLSDKKLADILEFVKVKQDDAFIVNSGTVHAIGKGVFLAEIQQASDITYRIYDWDRMGVSGKPRELHTDWAIDAIDFEAADFKLNYKDKLNTSVPLCSTKYFEVNKLLVNKEISKDISHIKSFMVYMCVGGEGSVMVNNKQEDLKTGDTFLIPACVEQINFAGENLKLLEVYI